MWATQQARLVSEFEVSDLEKYTAALNVAEFLGDPMPIAMILIDRRPSDLASVYEILQKGTPIFALLDTLGGSVQIPHTIGQIIYWSSAHSGFGLGEHELNFSVVTMEAMGAGHRTRSVYHRVPTEEHPSPFSYLSCLRRYSESKGEDLQFELMSDVLFARYAGESSLREGLSSDTNFRGPGLKLSLKR